MRATLQTEVPETAVAAVAVAAPTAVVMAVVTQVRLGMEPVARRHLDQ